MARNDNVGGKIGTVGCGKQEGASDTGGLTEEGGAKREVNEKLRRVSVLRLSESLEKTKLEADRDGYKTLVQGITEPSKQAAGRGWGQTRGAFPTALEI